MQELFNILSMLGPKERWSAARGSFKGASTAAEWLIVLAVVALIVLVIFVVWIFVAHKRSGNRLRQKIVELTDINDRLRRKIAELNREQLEVLESIIDAEPPPQEAFSLNAQEVKALSELGKRLL